MFVIEELKPKCICLYLIIKNVSSFKVSSFDKVDDILFVAASSLLF